MIGGPAGIWSALKQMPTLAWVRTGTPFAVMRVAPLIQRTMTHGCGFRTTTKAQPMTAYVSPTVRTGAPPIIRRGLLGIGCTCPPWGQVITAAMVSTGAGISSHRYRAVVDADCRALQTERRARLDRGRGVALEAGCRAALGAEGHLRLKREVHPRL